VEHDSSTRPVVEDADQKTAPAKQPGYFDSALEDVESVSSVDLSALSIGSERIRRRSVLERHVYKPMSQQVLHTPEAIELPELSPVSEYPGSISVPLTNRASTSLHPGPDISLWSTRDDLEVASQTPASVASTAADAMTSTLPLITASQRASYRRKSWLHLAPLYYCLFLEGWNDGSTGPMLPTIQRYYDVKHFLPRALDL